MGNPSNRNISTPEDIHRIAMAFQQSRILLTAVELDLFRAIGNKSLTSESIASKLDSGKRATDRLLNALCAIGLVSKKKNLFSNTPAAAKFLIKGKKEYMAGLMHTSGLWKTWNTLTDAVKKGSKAAPDPIKKRSPEWFESFISAMHHRASANAHLVVSKLDLKKVSKMVDIGGGSGAYAMAFVHAKKAMTAT
ncbi:MAG: methyltransferase dimerization domain-containing protein, partial [Desulfobacterales bacterium]|nr:methyltransferase dimerization domain-containing protein [Desulfobacterales bacterium]